MTTNVRTSTVREATFELLHAYGMTTIFGNVGSTEEPFLQDLPRTSSTSWGSKRRRSSRWPTDSRRRRAAQRS